MGDVDPELQTFAPLYIESVTIRDFRGLDECHLELEPGLTVLVGRNNCGKSRILRAICIALGGAAAELDDLTVGGASRATIDVVVAPPPPTALTDEEAFTEAVAQRLVDTKIISEDPYRERFAWRTTIRTSSEGFGARTEMQVLNYDMTGLPQVWLTSLSSGGAVREGCSHAEEVPRRVPA